MARLARVVIPGLPHHVTQRGNRRQRTFFLTSDYRAYLSLLARECGRHDVEVWAYCLMPNHVHIVAVPSSPDSLRRAVGEAHRRYTLQVNTRMDWKGHLWQGRFSSFALHEAHLLATARYVELNPVRAGLVTAPSDYPWSSARAHLCSRDDELVRVQPLLDLAGNWLQFLTRDVPDEELKHLRMHTRTGRPLGDEDFLRLLERRLGRILRRQKRGPRSCRRGE
jgi:putative transposase